MAAKGTIGGKIVLDGEKTYREALKNIKADQQELRSEMKLCSSEYKDSQNSLDALTKKHEILTKQVETQTQKVNVYQEAMANSAKKQEIASNKIAALKQELEKAEKEMSALSESSGDNSDAMTEQAKTIEDLKSKLEKAEESYNKAGQKAKYYQTALNDATAELNNMQDDLNKTSQYMSEAEKNTNKCATSIDELGKETGDAAEQVSIFGDVLKANLAADAIKTGVKAIANGLKEVATSATNVGTEFNASMSVVAATMGMTADEINAGSESYKQLENAAKECGVTTKFSATEAAEAENYLALAGYDVKKIVETLPKVLDLAAAGDMDLAYASDLVTDSMAALNMETSQLDNYIDEMTKTAQKSNTSVSQLGEATLVCAGAVSMAEMSLETMNGELGVLANNGIKGAEGGTHLRNVILSLAAPTDVASNTIESLGLQVADSSGNMRDLNDILIDLNSALDGMSSTEKTQTINKIFNKTDIAAVNALLNGTGDEFNNLYKEISNCKGAAGEMANTMNNNLKGDVTILKSALEGLGIAAEQIFDKDMRVAVQRATDAVDSLQRSVTKGELNTSLNKLSKSMADFCEGAMDLGENALPVAIDGLTWILDNADLVAAGVTGIAVANLQMNTVGPAIVAVQKAWEAYKTANEGATVSQWLLNIAMDANPAGLMITAVTGLAAAVAAYILINKDNLSVMSETTQKTNDLVESTRSLNEEYASAQKTREQSREGLEQEATAARKLVDELADLQKKTDLTTTEQTRQKQIIDELNAAYPDLNLQLDEQTGLLNMSTDAIYANIDALAAMDKANAAREDMAKIAEEQWAAEKKLSELQEQRTEQAREYAEAQEQLNNILDTATEVSRNAGQALQPYTDKVNQAKTALDSLDAEIANTNDSITSLSEEYEFCYNYISENEGIYNTAAATGQLGDAAAETGGQITGMSQEAQQALQDMYDTVQEAVKGQLDIFAEFQQGTQLSTTELLNNMQSQIDGITQWAENMELLADRGVNQGLLQHLAELGPEGAGYVATFVQMTDEELDKANDLFTAAMSLPDETTSSIMQSYQMAGERAAEGFKTGIKENSQKVAEQAGNMANDTVKATKGALDIHSPSRVYEGIGENIDQGLIKGIGNHRQQVISTINALCTTILTNSRTQLSLAAWEEIGRRIPTGITSGINKGNTSVVNAVQRIAQNAVNAAGGINVTTWETVGRRIPEGIAGGINSGSASAVGAVEEIARRSLEAGGNINTATWEEIGHRIPDGLTRGINDGSSSVVSAVERMARNAVEAARRELDIHSPSKKFEYMGEMSGEGYIAGWKETMADIDNVIAMSLPSANIIPDQGQTVTNNSTEKRIEINNEINFYTPTDDPIETARRIKESQQEAAQTW